MRGKEYFGFNFDESYGLNDDYNDEYGNSSNLDKLVSKPGFWQCSICTSENNETLSSCEICGVFRDFSNKCAIDVEECTIDPVHVTSKSSSASEMARLLFARNSHGAGTIATISDIFPCKEVQNCNEKGNLRARFADLQKTFVVPACNRRINIAPFRFDTPSPDDTIYARKNSSRIILKVDPPMSASMKASTSVSVKKSIINKISDGPSSSKPSRLNGISTIGAADTENTPHIISSESRHLNLDKKSVGRKADKFSQYKPDKWILSDQEGTSSQLNLAIVGHVDSGKSTLSGRLLHLLGRISRKEMHKKKAKGKGKVSFAYAQGVGEKTEERARDITMSVAVAHFNTKKYRIVLLDSPGHKDFVHKTISGVTLADAAILVVDASVGSFEAGMEGNGFGQTKEHAQLIRSFAVEQIIIAVNKMDVVEFSEQRFNFIKLQLGSFLRTCGFKESSVSWIPLSAMENQNLATTASDDQLSSWYHGYTLLEAIDSLQLPHRDLSKPLLLPICDVIPLQPGQVAVCGKLETGAIRNGLKVLALPSGDLVTVRSIERDSHTCSVARAGDHVAVSLQIEGTQLMPGWVLCHPNFPVKVASSLELKVLVLDISTPIVVGCRVEFQVHHAVEAARVMKLVSVLDQKTGKILNGAPPFLTAKQSATVQVDLDGAVCVEEFANCRALGRVFLRASGNTVAVGIITRVLDGAS